MNGGLYTAAIDNKNVKVLSSLGQINKSKTNKLIQ